MMSSFGNNFNSTLFADRNDQGGENVLFGKRLSNCSILSLNPQTFYVETETTNYVIIKYKIGQY